MAVVNENIIKEVSTYLDNYKQEMLSVLVQQIADDDGVDVDFIDPDEYVDSVELNEVIEDDLSDKGFTASEISQIQAQQMTDETCYKFLAYAIGLEDNFANVDELTNVLATSSYGNIENYTKEDLEKINQAASKLK